MTSSQLLLNFTVDQLQNLFINILSIFNDKLLVSSFGFSHLFIYSHNGHYLSTIVTINCDVLRDATWSPQGNIVYICTSNNSKVMVISESGKVLAKHHQFAEPRCLRVSNDNIIYLTEWEKGIYQSTDDGISWSFVFKLRDGCYHWQVIKVIADDSDDFWILERNGDDSNMYARLIVYSVNKKRSGNNMTLEIDSELFDFLDSSLSVDVDRNIFLSEAKNQSVHVFLMNGRYNGQLLSSNELQAKPWSLTVDQKRQLLYVGQDDGIVGAFNIIV